MIVFLTLIYVAFLFVLIKLKVLPNTTMTWLSTVVWMVVLFLFLFIPMQWGAPSGPIRVLTRAVQIVPNVSGQVVEITARANTPLKKDDLLYQIDPEPFSIAVSLAEATLVRVKAQAKQDQDALNNALGQLQQADAAEALAQARYDDDTKLLASGTISQNRLEKRQTNLESAQGAVDQARASVSRAQTELGSVSENGVAAKVTEAQAQLDSALWNLGQASVRAPSDGYVTNLALAVGQRVTNLPFAPAMVFVDTSEDILVAEVHQIFLRHVEPGQPVELAIKTRPGETLTGTVEQIIDLTSQGQAMVSGALPAAGNVQAEPFFVRIKMDESSDVEGILPGAVGTAAIYTQSMAPTHIIRKVMMRMGSIMNYINPAL